jgi:hypothetical protein
MTALVKVVGWVLLFLVALVFGLGVIFVAQAKAADLVCSETAVAEGIRYECIEVNTEDPASIATAPPSVKMYPVPKALPVIVPAVKFAIVVAQSLAVDIAKELILSEYRRYTSRPVQIHMMRSH